MKYLKLFENHQYYQEISLEEFSDNINWGSSFIKEKWVNFTKKEIDIIKKQLLISPRKIEGHIINKFEYTDNELSHKSKLFGRVCYSKAMIVYHHNPEFIPKIDNNWNGVTFYVIKLNDEWFYASNFESTYKCDQIDGLLKLISDKLI